MSSGQQLDALRTDNEHRLHHVQGDVGGEYSDQQEGEVDHIKAAERARQQARLGVEEETQPVLIVIMGVSGCGKSTLGAALAHAFGIPFVDGDSLHPQSNIDKMSSGVPLTDADRNPWLERIRAEAVRTVEEQSRSDSQVGRLRGIVVGCSALKRSYRYVLRGHSQSFPATSPSALPTYFIHIRGERDALLKRMENRKGHFMKVGMLDSQIRTLEPPEETNEPNVVTVDLEKSVDEQIEQSTTGLQRLGLRV